MNRLHMMQRVWTLAVCLVVSAVCQGSTSTTMELKSGQQYQMRSPEPIVRTAIGDPDLMSVKVINSRELLLTAKGVGKTSFMVWKKGYKDRLRYDVNIVEALPEEFDELASQAVKGGMVVTGKVESLAAHDRLTAALGENATDSTESKGPIQVQTDIRIVEISRSELKSAGSLLAKNSLNTTAAVGPPGSIGGVGSVGNGALSIISNSGFLPSTDAYSIIIGRAQKNLLGVISALHNNGYAYTLAEPSLVALSGQTASFLAGGEFPFPASAENGQIEIEFREFGVRLKLTPTVLDDNSIMLKVAPEVSELDFINGIQTGGVAVPSLRVRRTDTAVQLNSGESFIISGLISSKTASNADKFPGLGDIPILGAFFRSTRYESEDKELIMIVTPHLVKPMAAQATMPELPGELYRHHNPSFGDMLFGDPQPNEPEEKWASPGVGFSN